MQERILAIADRLFYGQGIRAVGVDTIAAEIASDGFRGCPFVNAVAELGEPTHPAHAIALAFKEQRRTWFRDRLLALEVADPESLATQLMLLSERAIAAALVRGDPAMARAAREAARVLLQAVGVKTAADAPHQPKRRRTSALK